MMRVFYSDIMIPKLSKEPTKSYRYNGLFYLKKMTYMGMLSTLISILFVIPGSLEIITTLSSSRVCPFKVLCYTMLKGRYC